jgi:hypothetical protein
MAVLELIIQRKSNTEIAVALGIGPGSASVHRHRIFYLLGSGKITIEALEGLKLASQQLAEAQSASSDKSSDRDGQE